MYFDDTWQRQFIYTELYGLYGKAVIENMGRIIKLYKFYDGQGQEWSVSNQDYIPTQKITNLSKKLIKEQARFLFGKVPEFTILSNKDHEEEAKRLNDFLNKVLIENKFEEKIIKAARDCFISGSIAIKVWGNKQGIKIMFRIPLEFVYETDIEDTDKLNKIIFFYQTNDELNKKDQRIWKQKYQVINEKCRLWEGIFDGNGKIIEKIFEDHDTGLDFIPATVILNDGLTGELHGESDLKEIMDNQIVYNKLTSDDIDALRFSLFPQTAVTDADENSVKNLVIAPNALIDLKSDVTSDKQVVIDKLEAKFNYDTRLENTLNRAKNDMYESLNIPNVSLEQLKGLMQSGKSMKAIYWPLVTKCEERWKSWKPALIFMAKTIFALNDLFKIDQTIKFDDKLFKVDVTNVFPLPEDEELEKSVDMQEVNTQVRSKKSYIKKWDINTEPDEELQQIQLEQSMFQDAYMGNLDTNTTDSNG